MFHELGCEMIEALVAMARLVPQIFLTVIQVCPLRLLFYYRSPLQVPRTPLRSADMGMGPMQQPLDFGIFQ